MLDWTITGLIIFDVSPTYRAVFSLLLLLVNTVTIKLVLVKVTISLEVIALPWLVLLPELLLKVCVLYITCVAVIVRSVLERFLFLFFFITIKWLCILVKNLITTILSKVTALYNSLAILVLSWLGLNYIQYPNFFSITLPNSIIAMSLMLVTNLYRSFLH